MPGYRVIDPSLLRALVLTILWSSQLQAPVARTLMISFHKIIGGYLSPFATSFALRPSGSIRRHMHAIKHPLESETEFPQRRRTNARPPGTSIARYFRELVLVTITDVHIKIHWIRCSVLALNVNYFFKVGIIEQRFKRKLFRLKELTI